MVHGVGIAMLMVMMTIMMMMIISTQCTRKIIHTVK